MREILAALLIGLLVGLGAGWKVTTWQRDSVDLAVKKAADAIRDNAIARESGIAKQVQDSIQSAAPAERVIDRGVIREIQKTEYRNVCFSPELVRLLNDGGKDRPTAADPGNATGDVPSGSAGAAQR